MLPAFRYILFWTFLTTIPVAFFTGCKSGETVTQNIQPSFRLIPTDTFHFNNFVDCNMAAAWVGDTFRIFSGKYGEDPVWGEARELKFSSGKHADETFSNPQSAYRAPALPPNAPIGQARSSWCRMV